MRKALLIGCGNIGALYDYDNNEVLTYARALSRKQSWEVSVADNNPELLARISNRYGFQPQQNPETADFTGYDLICIATPTAFHYQYLSKALSAGVPVIICEKPIAYAEDELDRLETQYKGTSSRVLVNYIRRFQPEYKILRGKITCELPLNKLRNIQINYKRGFLNNASHTIDTIEYLLSASILTDNTTVSSREYDVFPQDPTLSCIIKQPTFNINLKGHPYADYSVFDLHFQYDECDLFLTEAGNKITIEESVRGDCPVISYQRTKALENYMIPVLDSAESILENPTLPDNFLESLRLNRKMLAIIKDAPTHGQTSN